MTTSRVILRVKKVFSSGLLELMGCDGQILKDHSRNYAPCHLPNIDGNVDPNLSMILANLKCMPCDCAERATTMIL